MINLIGNELKKIFKKKTIYILLIIIIGYMILSNVMMKITNDSMYSYYYFMDGDLEYYENNLSDLDPSNESEFSMFLNSKVQVELIKLADDYGNNTWQAYIIFNRVIDYMNTILRYEYSDGITDEAYKEAKDNLNLAIEKFNTNDWRYFANEDLEEINSSLEEQYNFKKQAVSPSEEASIDKTIFSLNIEKQVAEWRLEKNIDYGPSFLNTALNDYSSYSTALLDYANTDIDELDSDELAQYRSALENMNLSKYYIENSISLDSLSRNSFINLFGNYELFILIVVIVIAGSIVSEEFNKGTIKLLLVKPYNRFKILFSKFIVCLIILLLTIGIVYISQLLIGGIINGFDGLNTPAIVYNFDTNHVETINIFVYVIILGICKLPMYILLLTLAFACSTIFANTALAVAVPFLGYIASSIINQFALLYKLDWIKFFVTPNWDLSCYLFGGLPLFKGLSAPFSIIICVIYLAILLLLSLVVFKKRDIKNI